METALGNRFPARPRGLQGEYIVSRSLSRIQAVVLGVAVLTGLVLGAVGLFAVGSRQWLWQDTFHVRVGFARIHGVEPGTRVRILGREAGEVEAVDLPAAPSGEVMLRLRLDGRLRHLVRADASAQIVSEGMVGGKVVEINPGSDSAEPVANDAVIAARPTTELTDVLGQVSHALNGIGNGEGSLGKLVKTDEAYQELVRLLRQGRGTMTSLQQNADAFKGLPLVRGYVKDPLRELVRPDCERNRKWFPESDLFEPGHAVLTAPGRKRLDDVVPWLDGLKHKGSEVVVAAFAHPTVDSDFARALTEKQSAAICDYLTEHHAVQKMGWFSRRRVVPVGCGTESFPTAEKESLPVPRVELLVFVPQETR
jgi:phospholipid/cholesterol/gamma-HCH transport system substrate-binding protein